jgi:hypothetical protein
MAMRVSVLRWQEGGWAAWARMGVEMITSSIRPLLLWMSGSSSAASTGSWSSSEKPPRKEGEPAVMTAWPLVERGASSRKRQVTRGRPINQTLARVVANFGREEFVF